MRKLRAGNLPKVTQPFFFFFLTEWWNQNSRPELRPIHPLVFRKVDLASKGRTGQKKQSPTPWGDISALGCFPDNPMNGRGSHGAFEEATEKPVSSVLWRSPQSRWLSQLTRYPISPNGFVVRVPDLVQPPEWWIGWAGPSLSSCLYLWLHPMLGH